MCKTGEIRAEEEKNVDKRMLVQWMSTQDTPDNTKEEEREAQDAQSLDKNCRESVLHLSRLIRGFCNKYHRSLLGEDQCEWHVMKRMIGPDCAIMYSLINPNKYIHTLPRLALVVLVPI